ncbi:hypothetical protein myaer87_43540 [Microcystis aeruginosa NIES-87]|nr:hypothetical protein myaer87_43540 [Microcystis aeruginosa NIES-87]
MMVTKLEVVNIAKTEVNTKSILLKSDVWIIALQQTFTFEKSQSK